MELKNGADIDYRSFKAGLHGFHALGALFPKLGPTVLGVRKKSSFQDGGTSPCSAVS